MIGRIAAQSASAHSSVEGLRAQTTVTERGRGCDPSAWRVSQGAIVEVPETALSQAFDPTLGSLANDVVRPRSTAPATPPREHATTRAQRRPDAADTGRETATARHSFRAHDAPSLARHARGDPSDAADTGLETPLTRHSFRVDDAPSAAPARRSKRPLGCRRHGWLDGSAQPLTVPAGKRSIVPTTGSQRRPPRALERARCDSHRPPGGSPDTPPGEVLHDPSAGCRDVCSAG